MKLDAVRPDHLPQARPSLAGERMSVRVRQLRLEAEVGIYASEHGRKQPITLDMEADVSADASRPNGALDEAVNYAALAEIARQIVGARHHDLLEDLAQEIADTIFRDPRITRLSISIDKLTALEDADSVGVSLERWR